MRLVRDALGLLVAGALLGLAGNGFTPRPAPLGAQVVAVAEEPAALCQQPGHVSAIPRISVEDAAPLCVSCSAAFVDARSAAEYESGHVTGAFHLAPGDPPEDVLWQLGAYQMIVVYDRDPSCAMADRVAKGLLARGAKDVRVLTGAWPAWAAAGAPGESGPCAGCGDHARPGATSAAGARAP